MAVSLDFQFVEFGEDAYCGAEEYALIRAAAMDEIIPALVFTRNLGVWMVFALDCLIRFSPSFWLKALRSPITQFILVKNGIPSSESPQRILFPLLRNLYPSYKNLR